VISERSFRWKNSHA